MEDCPIDTIPTAIKIWDLKPEHNPRLNFCVCQLYKDIVRRPVLITDCEHQFCLNCILPVIKGKNKDESNCPICQCPLTHENTKTSTKLQSMTEHLQISCTRFCDMLFNMKEIQNLKYHEECCRDKDCSMTSNESFTSTTPDDEIPRNMQDAALHTVSQNKNSTIYISNNKIPVRWAKGKCLQNPFLHNLVEN